MRIVSSIAGRFACFLGVALLFACGPAEAIADQPVVAALKGANLVIKVNPDRIRWGEQSEITVTATNSLGAKLAGGIFVTFDDNVIVLDVKGGTLLPSGTSAFNLKSSSQQPLKRSMVQSWASDWPAGSERSVVITVLPIAVERIRIGGRVTLLQRGTPATLHIAPGPIDSRFLDETGFPSSAGYLWITRQVSLRRTIRRFERKLRELPEEEQSRFATALAVALEDPKEFAELLQGSSDPGFKDTTRLLLDFAPKVSEKLRSDPIAAMEHLRCLMASLDCRRALFYFGAPAAIYSDLSKEAAARLAAKKQIEEEKGGNVLIALLEAEGIAYFREAAGGAIVIRFEGATFKPSQPGQVVRQVLECLVPAIGQAAADRAQGPNGSSFTSLAQQLGVATTAQACQVAVK